MAMFGPAAQMGMGQQIRAMPGGGGIGASAPLGLVGRLAMGIRAVRGGGGDGQRMLPMDFYRMMMMRLANPSTTSTSQVVSPGETQVIRPSAQAPQRRAAAPQAGASSSLITSTPSPAEVALATTSLLGG
jgi:hypothetical protein